jgi:hypothetical protein
VLKHTGPIRHRKREVEAANTVSQSVPSPAKLQVQESDMSQLGRAAVISCGRTLVKVLIEMRRVPEVSSGLSSSTRT